MKEAFETDIAQCLQRLNNGGIILYPTDTVWGLGCDATDENAVQKIIQIKNRPANKSFVVLVESIDRLKKYVSHIDDELIHFIESTKKPTTIIYQDATGFAESAIAEDNSVAIRICTDEFCKALIQKFNKPLLSTSANKSGENTPRIFPEIDKNIINEVDYVVRYRQDDLMIASPSTIVKIESGVIKIIRE